MTTGEPRTVSKVISPAEILQSDRYPGMYMDEKVEQYILNIVFAPGFPKNSGSKAQASDLAMVLRPGLLFTWQGQQKPMHL